MAPLHQKTPEIVRLLRKICERPPPLVWQVQHLWRKVGLLDDSHTPQLLQHPYASQEARQRAKWLPVVIELRKMGVSTSALMCTIVSLNPTQRADIDLLRQFNNAALRWFGEESKRWHNLKRLSDPTLYGICGPPNGLRNQAEEAIARLEQDRRTLEEVKPILAMGVAAIGKTTGSLYPQVSLEVVQIIDRYMHNWNDALNWGYKLVCVCDPGRASKNFPAFKKAVAVAQRRARSREGAEPTRTPTRLPKAEPTKRFTCTRCHVPGIPRRKIRAHLILCHTLPFRLITPLNDGELRHTRTGQLLATRTVPSPV